MKIFLNCTRNAILAMPPAFQKAEAMQEVKMLVVPKALRRTIFGNGIIEALANRRESFETG